MSSEIVLFDIPGYPKGHTKHPKCWSLNPWKGAAP